MRLSDIEAAFAAAGIDDAKEEARRLFAAYTDIPAYRLLGENPDSDNPLLLSGVKRRLKHEPLAYILGEAAFFNETYSVSPAVLIPRSDTEILVETAIRILPPSAHFLDFCTGSGCIAISVLAARKDCLATGYDISREAIAIAEENAKRNGVSSRVRFFCRDLRKSRVPTTGVAAILANPPYITEEEMTTLAPELSYEPRTALYGGTNGLSFYRTFLSLYAPAPTQKDSFVPPLFLFEIGCGQFAALSALAAQYGFSAECFPDLAGRDRVVLCRPLVAGEK